MSLLLALAAATPVQSFRDEAAREAARPVIDQLIGEGVDQYFSQGDDGGASFSFRSRPRASSEAGICESDWIGIGRATRNGPNYYTEPGAITGILSKRQFRILTVPGKGGGAPQPAWDVSGAALVKACAALPSDHAIWIDTDHQTNVRFAWHALSQAQAELKRHRSAKVKFSCLFARGCDVSDAKDIRFNQLLPELLTQASDRAGCDEDDVHCYRFHASGGACGVSWTGHFRLRYTSRWHEESKRMDERYELLSVDFERRQNSYDCMSHTGEDEDPPSENP